MSLFVPKRIICHHSATKDSGTVSWQAIRAYHLGLGWADIGYHAGVEWVQTTGRSGFECLYGRPWTMPGAHAAGHNGDTLGLCFVGDYDAVEPSADMLEVAVRRVLIPWCRTFAIAPSQIWGHCDFSTKSCPGKLFDLDVVRALVKQGL